MARVKDMTCGKPAPLLVAFALPLMLGNVFQQLYTVIDTAIVGKALGVIALGALGAVDWLAWMIVGMVQGFTQGFSIRMASTFGAKRYDELRRSVAISIILSALVAVFLLILAQLLALPVLKLLKTPAEVISGSLLYLRYIFAGIPIITAFNLLAAILRALGDGKTPLFAMIVAAITNILLDLLFVLVFRWGIAGAAIATLIAQFISCVYCFVHIKKLDILKLSREDFRELGPLVPKMLFLGTPMCLQNAIIAVGGMIIQTEVNRFGLVFLAGFTASNKLFGILEIAGTSYGFALVSYVGQNLGAKKHDRIRKGVNQGVLIAILTSMVIGGIMLLLGPWFISCFISGTPQQVAESSVIAYQYLSIMSIALPSLYILHAYRSSLQGLGDTVVPMLSGILELVMRTSLVFTLPHFIGPKGIFFAEVSAWIGAAVMLAIAYYIRMRTIVKRTYLDV